MRSKVKTGDVIQIRRNGPNYVTLGKVRDGDGVEYLAVTRNGNIADSGKMKASQPNRRPKIHVIEGKDVKRVHGTRTVDMESVLSASGNRSVSRHLQRTTSTTGVPTQAPNIAAQLAELASAI